jgi:hypothetical protein
LLDKVGRGDFAIIQLSTLEGHPFGPPLSGGPDVEREFRRSSTSAIAWCGPANAVCSMCRGSPERGPALYDRVTLKGN